MTVSNYHLVGQTPLINIPLSEALTPAVSRTYISDSALVDRADIVQYIDLTPGEAIDQIPHLCILNSSNSNSFTRPCALAQVFQPETSDGRMVHP